LLRESASDDCGERIHEDTQTVLEKKRFIQTARIEIGKSARQMIRLNLQIKRRHDRGKLQKLSGGFLGFKKAKQKSERRKQKGGNNGIRQRMRNNRQNVKKVDVEESRTDRSTLQNAINRGGGKNRMERLDDRKDVRREFGHQVLREIVRCNRCACVRNQTEEIR
jgi:hypothetical protein